MSQIRLWSVLIICHFSAAIGSQNLEEIATSDNIQILDGFIDSVGFDYCQNGFNLVTALVAEGNLKLLEEAVEKGADINMLCEGGYSALYIAALYNHVDVGQFLLQNKADLAFKDVNGRMAMDMAFSLNHIEFLQKVYRLNMDKYAGIDGPHIFDQGDSYEILQYRKEASEVFVDKQNVNSNAIDDMKFECLDEDMEALFSFQLNPIITEEQSVFEMPEKLVALSDIEGNFSALENLLKETGVINSSMDWIFGSGHVVFVGDFFDRGGQVTECLWLIYKLDGQAREAGGKVHFILGNHELMNLRDDYRYVHKKYLINAQLAGRPYKEFFSARSVLGQWLRTKNSVIRIGPYLFCHGGISPEFAAAGMTLPAINNSIRTLIDKSEIEVSQYVNGNLLIWEQGPLWYRGHFNQSHSFKDFKEILATYQSKYLIVGHTPVAEVKKMYKGRLIAIDVSHAKGPETQAAIMIENDEIQIVKGNGDRQIMK